MTGASAWADPPPLRWWGWGDRDVAVSAAFLRLLDQEVGRRQPPPPRPALEDVRLPSSRLATPTRDRLAAAIGADRVVDDHESRVRHATGRSYLDLLALRSGRLDAAPDAVLHPANAAGVRAILEVCSDAGVAVVPFGGGTSVVGGVTPLAGGHVAVISLDTGGLRDMTELDECSLTVRLGAGLRGPEVERRLAGRGLCLDHLPQSFEYASIGGYAATRSAGQMSGGAGRFEDLVLGLRCMTPTGLIEVAPQPASAAGPALSRWLIGSEGTLGVITDVVTRLRRLPASRRYEGFMLPSFGDGLAAVRQLAQAGLIPDVTRLSDEDETRASLALSDHGSIGDRLARGYLRGRGRSDGCLAICGWEGLPALVGTRARLAAGVLRDHGAISLGGAPGRAWLRERFTGPYLRDVLMDRGLLVETLETATSWDGLSRLRDSVVGSLDRTLAGSGTPALLGCHVSHVYPNGASLYVTVIARRAGGDPVGQWRAAKAAASRAILDLGATISHHHGVGVDHAPYLTAEAGEAGIRLLAAAKGEVDPVGILNPGKLLLADATFPGMPVR